MGEKAVSRPWSRVEDDLLRRAVDKHGIQDNWKAVALEVPDRNNKACRKRWLHSLSPSIKKSAWTAEEDHLLVTLYNTHGPKWSFIARQIEGRTDDACSKRYNEALNPSLNKAEWTVEEDDKLIQAYAEVGGKWKDIGQRLQRSGLGCRNRWKLLERKGMILRPSSPSGGNHTLPRPSGPPPTDTLFPYYPPESYPLFSQEESSTTFREPTPEVPATLPTPPPFQFSSSSLSAALLDPPRICRYPTISDDLQTDLAFRANDTPLSSSSSPSSSSYASPELADDLMSLDDNAHIAHLDSSGGERNALPTLYSFDGGAFVSSEFSICPSGPSRIQHSPMSQDELYKSPHIDTMEELQYSHNHFTESPFSGTSSDIVSTAPSSPSGQPASISLTSSPNVDSPVELNGSESSISDSLLFSSTPPSSDVVRDPVSIPRKQALPSSHARLSSVMPLSTDRSLRPYACGHSTCWPPSADTSSACFPTSRELFEHCKLHHEFDDERPYRCALPDCGKSWKSLNGLQYHLQISTAHFQQAMCNRFLSQSASIEALETEPSDKELKRYVCDQPNCFKTYKNSSGLRYHKKHGHPKKLPMQLTDMPPALARDLPSRTKKMRQKDQCAVYE